MPTASARTARGTSEAAWMPAAALAVGVWLVIGTWLIPHQRQWLAVAEAACGLAAAFIAWRWLGQRRPWQRWALTAVGCTVIALPLVFWAASPWACLAALLAGVALVLVAGAAPSWTALDEGADLPPGWGYNPSSRGQRAPIVVLALAGTAMAGYLATFHLGYIDEVWDPFFGEGTRRTLESDISRWFPVSDAGLGALSYLIEALSGMIGDRRRWRTAPWMVLFFGLMIIPSGVVSITLVVLQPIGVGAWCTLCLATALVMLVMVSPALDEVVASCQFLGRERRRGRFWRSFWRGGVEPAAAAPPEPPPSAPRTLRQRLARPPWTLLAAAAIGGWLMGAPYVTGASGAAANDSHLTGALIATFAVIGLAEVARPARLLAALAGLWLVAGGWSLAGATTASHASDALGGLLAIALCLPRGAIRGAYGGWNRVLRW